MPGDPTYTYPPLHHHSSTPLSPRSAAAPLAAYLESSLTRPYLHPDAWLSLEGVRHGPKSGPQGSWAMHHLRRIEAGMRGEVLAVESTEELVERFGEEIVGENMPTGRSFRKEEPEEEEEVEEKPQQQQPRPVAAKPEHEMTKAEKKKARRAAERAEVQRAREAGEEVPTFGKKRKRASEAVKSEGEPSIVTADINDPSQYESAEKYNLEQETLLEDVGDRDPAGVDREDAVKAPVVVEHDKEGEVIVPPETKKRKADVEETEAIRAAKKAKKAEKMAKKESVGEDVEMVDAAAASTPAEGAQLSKKQKKALRKSQGAEAAPETPAQTSAAAGAASGGAQQLSRKQKRQSQGGHSAAPTHTPATEPKPVKNEGDGSAQTNGTPAKSKKERKNSIVSAGSPASVKKEEKNVKQEETAGGASTSMNGIPAAGTAQKLSKAEKKKLKKEKVKQEAESSS